MENPVAIYHPFHLAFCLGEILREENNLVILFDKLAAIDPLERRWILMYLPDYIGVKPIRDCATDEEESDALLHSLKVRCGDLLDTGMTDFFLAYAIVCCLCNQLNIQSDPNLADANKRRMQRAIGFFQSRAKDGLTDQETADSCSRMAEEVMNNSLANANLSRGRYHLFCNTVVRAMLPERLTRDFPDLPDSTPKK